MMKSQSPPDSVVNKKVENRRCQIRRWLGPLVRIPAMVYLGILILLVLFENRMVYVPAPFPPGPGHDAEDLIEDLFFESDDGTRLHAWYLPSERPRAHVLFLHGNAGNLLDRKRLLLRLRTQQQITLLALDYRGYGRSEGQPNESGILADARAARRELALRTGIEEKRIFLYGRSLGGGVAVDLAAKDGARGLILQSTFSSLPDVAAKAYPWLPVRWLMRNRLDSLSKIRSYAGPLLQAHSQEDEVIPFELGRKLYEHASSPKQFIEFRGVGHNDPTPRTFDAPLEQFLSSH